MVVKGMWKTCPALMRTDVSVSPVGVVMGWLSGMTSSRSATRSVCGEAGCRRRLRAGEGEGGAEKEVCSQYTRISGRKQRRDAPFLDDGVEELEPLDVVVAEVAADLADLLAEALLHLGVARELEEREAERARRRLVPDHDERVHLQRQC